MAVSRLHAYADAVLPGLGLAAQGRGWALLLLVAAAGGAGAALVLEPLALRLGGVWLWAVAALVAVCVRWACFRRTAANPERIRQLARATLAAWLGGQDPRQSLVALLRAAPEEPGAWDLAGRIAADLGDHRLAARARRRQELLLTR